MDQGGLLWADRGNCVFISCYSTAGAKAIQGQRDCVTATGSQASTSSFPRYDQEVVQVTSAPTPLASTMSHGYP